MKQKETPIYVIIGTRAQFIKVAPLLRMMTDQKMKYELIYTAQHQETIQEILDVYKLPPPDKVMYRYTEAMTKKLFMRWFFFVFWQMIFHPKKWLPRKGIVLTHGDTFTAWMAAIMGRLAGCRVGHLESGLRSFNLFKPFPEEISRIITFIFSNIYFCPNQWAVDNLKRFRGVKVNLKMNPIYDAVMYAIKNPSRTEFDFQKSNYAIVSIHRYENIFSDRFTKFIIPKFKEISDKVPLVLTLHPTTREQLKK